MLNIESFKKEAAAVQELRDKYATLLSTVNNNGGDAPKDEIHLRFQLTQVWNSVVNGSKTLYGEMPQKSKCGIMVLSLVMEPQWSTGSNGQAERFYSDLQKFFKTGELPNFKGLPKPRDGNQYARYV